MTMKDKDLLKLLIKDGWEEDRTSGSHHILCKGSKTISLPVHGKDMKIGTLKDIIKKTNLRWK
jgi:mRNA interferase HicA